MFGFEKRKDSRPGDRPFAVDCCTMVKRIRTAATDSFRPISWQTARYTGCENVKTMRNATCTEAFGRAQNLEMPLIVPLTFQ